MSAEQFIYIHVPFCEQKCAYCDFYTITDPEGAHSLTRQWLQLVAGEMTLWTDAGDLDRAAPIRTIFFGGGTPSLTDPEDLKQFLDFARSEYTFSPDIEITVEMQPRTADAEKLAAYAKAGVNRFSIGVQTFNDGILSLTGRRHTAEQSRQMIRNASKCGIASLDLISAMPGQTLDTWRAELEEAISFGTPHISVYELTFHAGTEFYRRLRDGRMTEAGEDLRVAMFEETRRTLQAAGYEHYEISNYAKPGFQSVHNRNYWRLGNYIGLGAGAHSFVFPHRYINASHAADYAAAINAGRLFRRISDAESRDLFILENLQMGLRLSEGIDLGAFCEKFGSDIAVTHAKQFEELKSAGLLEQNGPRIQLTPDGQLRVDSIIQYLL
jgi:oxygen-independent coproporphyrinogen-3 oxidase